MAGELLKTSRLKKKGMTLKRIIFVEMVFLLIAQMFVLFIGLFYANSINSTIRTQRTELMAEQYTQNIKSRLNDINNLLLFLNTSDIHNYYKNYMKLRGPEVVKKATGQLEGKIEALHLSDSSIKSIYVIGRNKTQMANHIITDTQELVDLNDLRVDTLQNASLEELLLRNQNMFSYYDIEDLKGIYTPYQPAITDEERIELEAFIQDISGQIVIGNYSGQHNYMVLTLLVLDSNYFSKDFIPPDNKTHYSVLDKNGAVLWSTSKDKEVLRSVAESGSSSREEGNWRHIRKDIPSFNLRTVYSETLSVEFFRQSRLPHYILLSAVGILAASFLLSFIYLRTMLRPFRRISQAIDAQPNTDGETILLNPIDSLKAGKVFHSKPLKHKLTLLFCIVIGILISLNALVYLRYMDKEIDNWIAGVVDDVGSLAVAGVSSQIQYFENLSNQLSLSETLQRYLINAAPESVLFKPMEIFPGLNDMSYFVVLNKNGTSLYSSIFSINPPLFNIASYHLKDTVKPYWIYYFNNNLNDFYTAVVRKMEPADPGASAAYLLIVPKESAFPIAETKNTLTAYTLENSSGNVLYTQRDTLQLKNVSERLRYTKALNNTGWILTIDYVIPEVDSTEKAYRYQFYISMAAVLLISLEIASRISFVLTRSLHQICTEMGRALAESNPRLLVYDKHDEISAIIGSYNRMIVRLEEIVQDNMRILEENAMNKIREKELLSMKTRAEMNMLQAQINPHFLYNTLNVISIQSIRHGNKGVSHMLQALSELLRYSMTISPETAPLEQELKHASNYVTLQKIRFGDSFNASFDISQELYGYCVLRIILQPLIENAIQHGFEGWESGGLIRVSARLENGNLILRIRDNGMGMDEKTLERLQREMTRDLKDWKAEREGIGLLNVYYRMRIRYQEKCSLSITSALMKGTDIYMVFPAEKSENRGNSDKNIR